MGVNIRIVNTRIDNGGIRIDNGVGWIMGVGVIMRVGWITGVLEWIMGKY